VKRERGEELKKGAKIKGIKNKSAYSWHTPVMKYIGYRKE
jgi:hypothetical protein